MDSQETRKWVKYLQAMWKDAVSRQRADQQLEENSRATPGGEWPTTFQPHANTSSSPLDRSNPFGTPTLSSSHSRPNGSSAARTPATHEIAKMNAKKSARVTNPEELPRLLRF